MKIRLFLLIFLCTLAFSCQSEPSQLVEEDGWDTYSDTWVADDELGRRVLTTEDGLEAPSDRLVGMFYYIWHGTHGQSGRQIFDITELLRQNPENPQFGEPGEFHWWGKPVMGHYVSHDRFVVEKHMQMLMDAGIDFIFFDCTNAYTYDHVVDVVMQVIDDRAAKGMRVPKLSYMVNSEPEKTIQHIYETYYTDPKYDKYWFEYDGKPLILADPKAASPEARARFTFRRSWAWMKGENPQEWPWLESYPQVPGYGADGEVEQISVSVAQHPSGNIGKSFHDGQQPPIDEYAVTEYTPQGLYMAEQWERAHEVKAPILMFTQFNEWIAMRFIANTQGETVHVRPGGEKKIGESFFVDAYNAEYNRDIEPTYDPDIRDNYYMQMVSNVRKYKGVRPLPVASGPKTIELGKGMSQWKGVAPQFRDDIGDITHRDTKGYNDMEPMVNTTGRNDIVSAKVARDSDHLYFYVHTAGAMTDPATGNWMMLLLNSDMDYKTGWNGYDYLLKEQDGSYVVCRNAGEGFAWEPVGEAAYELAGDELQLVVPFSLTGLGSGSSFDFKWADNIPENPDILDFIQYGDVAPNGRFNYRYKVE